MLDDAPLIAMAREKGIQSLMHLSTLTPDGSFSNELSTAIFNDAAARSNLIGNIIRNMRQKGYAGLDVDFEYVLPEDREGYVQFRPRAASAAPSFGVSPGHCAGSQDQCRPAGPALRGA